MPRPSSPPPLYRKHTTRNLGVVTLGDSVTKARRSYYLGEFDTPSSREKYHRLIAQWEANGRRLPSIADAQPNSEAPSGVTVGELILHYWRWAKQHQKAVAGNLVVVLRVVAQMFGMTAAADFGPRKLRLVREAMVRGDPTAKPPRRPWTRESINKQIRRIAAVFKWAAGQEIASVSVYQVLKTLEPLKRGQTAAREPEVVTPVSLEIVSATRPHLNRQINALIDLQLLTGARGGELFTLRRGDIDRTRAIWTYTPLDHKTSGHGKTRTIYFGPRAQGVLAPYMLRPDEAYLFSPAEAEKERREQAHAERKTPLKYGNRPGMHANEEHSAGGPGDCYTKDSYCRAIQRACMRAFIAPEQLARIKVKSKDRPNTPRWETDAEWKKRLGPAKWEELRQWNREHIWHPHQLRHTAATTIRREFGLEAAQVALGHSSALITDAVYAERDLAKVEEVMLKIG